MKKIWLLLLSMMFVTLVACNSKDKEEDTANEKTEDKTEQTDKTKDDAENDTTENKDVSSKSTTAEYDESKQETNMMKMSRPGVEGTIEFVHSDDVLLKQLQKTEISYELAGVKDEKEAKEQVKELGDEEKYKDQEGVEYKVEYGKDAYTETFNVDFTKADLSLVSSIPEGSEGAERYVSYQSSLDNFKKQGYYLEGETATEVFKLEQEGYLYEVQIEHEDNKVLKQTTFNEQTYEALGIKDKKEAEEKFKETADHYKELNKEDGVNFNLQFLDDRFTVDGEMDYEKMKDIKKVIGMMNSGSEEADSAELVRNYSVMASSLIGSGLEHVETKE